MALDDPRTVSPDGRPGATVGTLDTAPGWIWVGYLGWAGIFFRYPAWAIWFGRSLTAAVGTEGAEAA